MPYVLMKTSNINMPQTFIVTVPILRDIWFLAHLFEVQQYYLMSSWIRIIVSIHLCYSVGVLSDRHGTVRLLFNLSSI